VHDNSRNKGSSADPKFWGPGFVLRRRKAADLKIGGLRYPRVFCFLPTCPLPTAYSLLPTAVLLVFVQLPDHLGDERAHLFQAPGALVAAHLDHHVLADRVIPPGARFGGAHFLLTLAELPGDLRQGLPLPL